MKRGGKLLGVVGPGLAALALLLVFYLALGPTQPGPAETGLWRWALEIIFGGVALVVLLQLAAEWRAWSKRSRAGASAMPVAVQSAPKPPRGAADPTVEQAGWIAAFERHGLASDAAIGSALAAEYGDAADVLDLFGVIAEREPSGRMGAIQLDVEGERSSYAAAIDTVARTLDGLVELRMVDFAAEGAMTLEIDGEAQGFEVETSGKHISTQWLDAVAVALAQSTDYRLHAVFIDMTQWVLVLREGEWEPFLDALGRPEHLAVHA